MRRWNSRSGCVRAEKQLSGAGLFAPIHRQYDCISFCLLFRSGYVLFLWLCTLFCLFRSITCATHTGTWLKSATTRYARCFVRIVCRCLFLSFFSLFLLFLLLLFIRWLCCCLCWWYSNTIMIFYMWQSVHTLYLIAYSTLHFILLEIAIL